MIAIMCNFFLDLALYGRATPAVLVYHSPLYY